MSIAFFDLDLTLLSVNSGALWVRRQLREGSITRLQGLRALGWIVKYQLGFAKLEQALGLAIASLEGQDEAAMRQRSYVFWDEELAKTVRPGARAAVESHRAAGDKLVLLTSSSLFLSERAVDALCLDGALCNRFEVDDAGRFTGRSLGRLCYGEGKLALAEAWANERGVDLASCTFYTDSSSDVPVMLGVGRPVAVNPDPRLKRLARRRGWPVLDWGK